MNCVQDDMRDLDICRLQIAARIGCQVEVRNEFLKLAGRRSHVKIYLAVIPDAKTEAI